MVRNYAPKIFTSVGFGYHESLLFNLVLGGMKVASTAVAIFFVDTVGRKPLLMGGITLSSAGMLMLVLSFATGLESNVGKCALTRHLSRNRCFCRMCCWPQDCSCAQDC